MVIRSLTPEDAPAYVALRREMLADSPWAFAASPEEDRALDPAFVAMQVQEPGQAIIGAFDEDGALRAVAGIFRQRHPKMAHRAHVWGVYVTPAARRRDLGRQVVSLALEIARSWPGITSAGLSASARSTDACRLYEALGFRAWGREPGALVLDGEAIDEIHMVLFFE